MKMLEAIRNPRKVLFSLGMHGKLNFMRDEQYLKFMYYCEFGKKLNLENPQTFNEKLQWLKLHDRNPEYTIMVDKYKAKEYVRDKVGERYVIPTLGVWERFDDIDFDSLPEQFVLKCTHDSGGLIIVRDKNKLDQIKAKKKLENSMRRNYFDVGREWPYKNVVPRIIAEKYLESTTENEGLEENCLTDYKFFCFGGEPKIAYISKDKSEYPRTDFFDMEYNLLQLRMKDPNSECPPPKPETYEKMQDLARILSEGIPHLRVDFYSIDGKVYVGEMTFYHCSGFAMICPSEWNYKLGSWIHLPENHI